MLKILLYALGIAYIVSPYDLLPDFLFGAGWLDDIALIGILLWYFNSLRKKKSAFRNRFQGEAGRNEQHKETSSDSGYEGYKGSPSRDYKTKDPYAVLGIGPSASKNEVREAYKRLASKYHPDKVMHLGDEFQQLAEERFKEIQKAYQELSERR